MTDVQIALFSYASQQPDRLRWITDLSEREKYVRSQKSLLSLREKLEQRSDEELKALLSRYDDDLFLFQALNEQSFFFQGLSMGLQLIASGLISGA